MSTHIVDIIEIGDIYSHPNADLLECTQMHGWQCCIGKGQFKKGDKVVFLEPDFVVNLSNPLFSFLRKEGENKTHHRIRVLRQRGELSQGLIIPVPDNLKHLPLGTNVIDELGVIRYKPPIPLESGALFVSGPSGLYTPTFDVENYQRYKDCFTPGEEIIATEKMQGASARYVYWYDKDGIEQQFCGSRENWISSESDNCYWRAFRRDPAIGGWCKNNPGKLLYGECFGQVGGFKYGGNNNDVFFACFNILDKQRWLDYDDVVESCNEYGIKTVPMLYRGPLDEKIIYELAEEDSAWPKSENIREGVVIVPVKERKETRLTLSRACLKVVSNNYLSGKKERREAKKNKNSNPVSS